MLYEDLPRIIADMIREQWDLTLGDEPVITYDRTGYFQESRVGSIYVYQTNRTNTISTVDYRTLERHAYLAIRLTNPDRDRHLMWGEEVCRIIMANRRAGPAKLGGYEYMELMDDTTLNDPLGWYQTTFDLRLTTFAHRIRSSGFGVDRFGDPVGPNVGESGNL